MAAVYVIAKVLSLSPSPTSTRALRGFVNFIVPEPSNACVRPPVISLQGVAASVKRYRESTPVGTVLSRRSAHSVTNRDGSIGDADFIAFVYLTDVDRYLPARNAQ